METNAVDLLIVNGENAAGGFGITPSIAEEISRWARMSSPPATTSGTRKRSSSTWPSPPNRTGAAAACFARPTTPLARRAWAFTRASFPPASRMRWSTCRAGLHVHVRRPLSHGRCAAGEARGQGHPRRLPRRGHVEKVALGWYLDGRVTAVLGTHTHVPTADERLLHNGTAYQTDVGMCGSLDSVIGVETELVCTASSPECRASSSRPRATRRCAPR